MHYNSRKEVDNKLGITHHIRIRDHTIHNNGAGLGWLGPGKRRGEKISSKKEVDVKRRKKPKQRKEDINSVHHIILTSLACCLYNMVNLVSLEKGMGDKDKSSSDIVISAVVGFPDNSRIWHERAMVYHCIRCRVGINNNITDSCSLGKENLGRGRDRAKTSSEAISHIPVNGGGGGTCHSTVLYSTISRRRVKPRLRTI